MHVQQHPTRLKCPSPVKDTQLTFCIEGTAPTAAMDMLGMVMTHRIDRHAILRRHLVACFLAGLCNLFTSAHNLALVLLQFLERLKSHRLLAKLKQTFLDMGISVGDVAVIPKVQASLFFQPFYSGQSWLYQTTGRSVGYR